jgi:hypothetical protein
MAQPFLSNSPASLSKAFISGSMAFIFFKLHFSFFKVAQFHCPSEYLSELGGGFSESNRILKLKCWWGRRIAPG